MTLIETPADDAAGTVRRMYAAERTRHGCVPEYARLFAPAPRSCAGPTDVAGMEIVAVVLAASARSFLSTVLGALGAARIASRPAARARAAGSADGRPPGARPGLNGRPTDVTAADAVLDNRRER